MECDVINVEGVVLTFYMLAQNKQKDSIQPTKEPTDNVEMLLLVASGSAAKIAEMKPAWKLACMLVFNTA